MATASNIQKVSWKALGNIYAHSMGPSRVMSSMGWWVGKETVHGVEERIVPEEWSYMDIVARMYSLIVASVAEREEVRECMELLKKSFGIGQQCGCANANVKRKANKEKEDYKVGRRSNARGGEVEGIKKVG